jgi:hypothetical protein
MQHATPVAVDGGLKEINDWRRRRSREEEEAEDEPRLEAIAANTYKTSNSWNSRILQWTG